MICICRPARSPKFLDKREQLLSDFQEEICRNPNADFDSTITAFAEEFEKLERKHEEYLVKALILNLYAGDTESLRRDIGKLAVAGEAEADPAQRVALFRCLYEVLSQIIKGDFSEILADFPRVVYPSEKGWKP